MLVLVSLSKQHRVVARFVFREDVDDLRVQEPLLQLDDGLAFANVGQVHQFLDVLVDFTVLPVHVDHFDFWLFLFFSWRLGFFFDMNWRLSLVRKLRLVLLLPLSPHRAADGRRTVVKDWLWFLLDALSRGGLIYSLNGLNLGRGILQLRLLRSEWSRKDWGQADIPGLRFGCVLLNKLDTLTHCPCRKSSIVELTVILDTNVSDGLLILRHW